MEMSSLRGINFYRNTKNRARKLMSLKPFTDFSQAANWFSSISFGVGLSFFQKFVFAKIAKHAVPGVRTRAGL